MRRYCTPIAKISVWRQKMRISQGAKPNTNTDTARLNTHAAATEKRMPRRILFLTGPIVLRNESGKGISEILHRHIGKRVDLDRRGKKRP